ncbi:MAG: hypothetical protein QXR80_07345, partial [Desulfurococcaceae archaeon]
MIEEAAAVFTAVVSNAVAHLRHIPALHGLYPFSAVDVLLRCGPGAVLTQPQHFYSVFYRQCTSLAKYARLPSARGRRSWGLAVRRPGEFFCALISRLAADLGI